MVYFTCGACGEQIKKPQVEKHYMGKCRNCNLLTCIDCLKDFHGDEYKSHTQCMTEAQRYSKSGREGWDPNQGQGNKGEKKQQEWMNRLRGILDDSSTTLQPSVRKIVDTILENDNIPRKRQKFINFIKNTMRVPYRDIESTWDIFSQALAPPKPPPVKKPDPVEEPEQTDKDVPEESEKKKKKKDKKKNCEIVEVTEVKTKRESNKEKKKKQKKNKENEETEDTPMEEITPADQNNKQKKGKKRKHENGATESAEINGDDTMEVDNDEDGPAAKKVKFDWDATIQAVLSKKGNQMKLKKLKKKCVSEYFVQNPNAHQTPEQIGTKFDKKINKRQNYKVIGEEVHLNERDEVKAEEVTKNCDEKVEQNGADNKVVNGSEAKISFNAWEAASLGSDSQTDKFRRLMGIKSNVTAKDLTEVKKRNDQAILKDLEQGFKQARTTHFKEKGMGLGWAHGE